MPDLADDTESDERDHDHTDTADPPASRSVEPSASRALRLTVTLPGSASLGAFQGGATAALSVLIRSLRSHGYTVDVDAVGGASAGSIVAMLFSHCLATGRDAPRLLREAWVDEVDLDLLRCGGADAPLAFDDLRSRLVSFLDDSERHPMGLHEPVDRPIAVQVGLTTLLGFTTDVETAGTTSSTLSYVDWMGFDVRPRGDCTDVTEPEGRSLLDAVLVSASHPGAFAPRSLDRSQDREAYAQRGVTNLPDAGVVWYTDGGLVESSPIGRVLDAARNADGRSDATRVHLVIDPRSSGPSADGRWKDPDADPSWLDGIRRALSILPTQALHDDLRDIATVNDRLAALDALMDDLDGQGPENLRERIAALAGIDGKEPVDVSIISPLLRADDGTGVNDLLAGDFIGAFGGFLDRSIRRSDFALGWSCTRAWVDRHLGTRGVDRVDVDAALATIDESSEVNWGDVTITGDSMDQLSRSGRWRLALLAMRIGHVLTREALPSPASMLRRRLPSR